MSSIVKKFLQSGSARSLLAKKNAIANVIFKGAGIVVSLLLVRLTLEYVDEYQYGTWLTLSSLLTWLNFCDIGFGHGLRNKLAESLAKKDFVSAKNYVSTAFVCFSCIAIAIFALLAMAYPFLDWNKLLNCTKNTIPHLNLFILLLIAIFLLDFVLKNIAIIYTADMVPCMSGAFTLIANMLTLAAIVVMLLVKKTGTFIEVGIITLSSTVLVHAIAFPYTFIVKYPKIAPSIKNFQKKHISSLMELGGLFFILQISVVIMFFSSNLIISHIFSPREVTPYNIAYRYFSAAFMFWAAGIAPLWSAITNAYAQNDFAWIVQMMKKLRTYWIIATVLLCMMLLVSPIIYRIWLGDTVKIPFQLSALTMLLVVAMMGNSIYTSFINGIGKIKLQVWISILTSVLFPPCGIIMCKVFGVSGIVISQTLLLSASVLVMFKQTRLIIEQKAKGIWNT